MIDEDNRTKYNLHYKVDIDKFKRIFERNDGRCLTKLGVSCPCQEFIEYQNCKCGVFTYE